MMSEWISVSKKKPKINQFVDIYCLQQGRMCDYRYIGRGEFEGGRWSKYPVISCHDYSDPVTHWMPLPEPPKN